MTNGFWIENYLQGVAVSVLLSGLILPKIILIAFRRKLFDQIDERKIHRGVVPRLGGISFFPSMMFALCMVLGFDMRFGRVDITPFMEPALMPLMFVICALLLMYLVGIADDLVGVRYRAKFLFQIMSGLLILISGLGMYNLYGFLWINELPTALVWILTILVIVYIVNAFNLIDGIDGLASGLGVICLLFYTLVFYGAGLYIWLMLAGVTLGTLIPFFIFNVFGKAEKHSKIFMGDTGSLTIGLTIAVLFISVISIEPEPFTHGPNMLIIAVAPIIIPCLDVVRVFLHRVRRGRSPFLPDKCHIHHKLLALGIGQKKALIIILLVDVAFVLCDYYFATYVNPNIIVGANIIIWVVLNCWMSAMIRKREARLGKQLYD